MSDRIIVLSPRPGTVKEIHDIRFDCENEAYLPPLERRNTAAFGRYFNLIWKELDVHVEP